MPTRGDAVEAQVLAVFTRLGLDVLIPWAHDLPFDLVVYLGADRFVRVQCKAGRHKDGCVVFNSASTDHGRGNRSYVGRADVFAVYCPALDRVFVVPVAVAATRSTRLRLAPSRNNQRRRVNAAETYAVEAWAEAVAGARLTGMTGNGTGNDEPGPASRRAGTCSSSAAPAPPSGSSVRP